jgi:predicted translin family RNA/ssDNA-binding protein
MSELEKTLGWQGSDPFYAHLLKILDAEFEKRSLFNSGLTLNEQLTHLEDWYECVETLYSRVFAFFLPKEYESIDFLLKEIDTKTNGDNFVSAKLSTNDVIDIRKKLKEISRRLSALMTKYEFFVKLGHKQQFENIADEVDAENSQ